MIWWLTDPGRANAEMSAVAELQDRAPWLGDVIWAIESPARLIATFTIQHLDRAIPFKMAYPAFFPDAPPQVVPVEPERLSMHQYGADGELCLEFRPDNWSPEITGAMMIDSAHRLLTGEAPSEGETATVPSAHRVNLGQALRSTWLRLVLPYELRLVLVALEPGRVEEVEYTEHIASKRFLVNPIRLGPKETPLWCTENSVEDSTLRTGFALRLGAGASVPAPLDKATVRGLFAVAGATESLNRLDEAAQELYVLIVATDEVKLVSLLVGQEKIYEYDTVRLPEPRARLSDEHARLAEKAVAIVGCGSVGSKIAASLARAGIGRFVLVDDDILVPGNLVRNDLDGRSVGLHKADAVNARIKNINPRASVDVRRMALGGQEASSSADNMIKAIAGCDHIIDATADPQGFNLCASIARRNKKPLIWGEVFAGGIGGLIARSRPELDPPPHHARRQLLAWCEERNVPWLGGAEIDYDIQPEDRPPLIADDSAVTLIAGYMTSMALDLFLREAESRFASSAYFIGFAKEWMFSGPFDVWPVDYAPEGAWGAELAEDHADQLKALVGAILPSLPSDGDEG